MSKLGVGLEGIVFNFQAFLNGDAAGGVVTSKKLTIEMMMQDQN